MANVCVFANVCLWQARRRPAQPRGVGKKRRHEALATQYLKQSVNAYHGRLPLCMQNAWLRAHRRHRSPLSCPWWSSQEPAQQRALRTNQSAAILTIEKSERRERLWRWYKKLAWSICIHVMNAHNHHEWVSTNVLSERHITSPQTLSWFYNWTKCGHNNMARYHIHAKSSQTSDMYVCHVNDSPDNATDWESSIPRNSTLPCQVTTIATNWIIDCNLQIKARKCWTSVSSYW